MRRCTCKVDRGVRIELPLSLAGSVGYGTGMEPAQE